jgi:hypothetical protein
MRRQELTGKNGWIDLDTAQQFEELVWCDGRNCISTATGSPFDHESLWRSRAGNWILHAWSQFQEPADSWTKLAPSEAARWLIHNGHEHEELADLMDSITVSARSG